MPKHTSKTMAEGITMPDTFLEVKCSADCVGGSFSVDRNYISLAVDVGLAVTGVGLSVHAASLSIKVLKHLPFTKGAVKRQADALAGVLINFVNKSSGVVFGGRTYISSTWKSRLGDLLISTSVGDATSKILDYADGSYDNRITLG